MGHEPLAGEKIKLRWRVKKNEIPRTKPTGPAPEQGLPVITPSIEDNSFKTPPQPTGENIIPGIPNDPVISSGSVPNPPTNFSSVHIVTQGETLFRVAAKYGITVDQLKRINNLTSDNIQPGQKLNLK